MLEDKMSNPKFYIEGNKWFYENVRPSYKEIKNSYSSQRTSYNNTGTSYWVGQQSSPFYSAHSYLNNHIPLSATTNYSNKRSARVGYEAQCCEQPSHPIYQREIKPNYMFEEPWGPYRKKNLPTTPFFLY